MRPALLIGAALLLATPAAARSGAATHTRGRAPAPVRPTPTARAPRTLAEALVETYSYNPALLAERAKLRATDEGVPQAVAGWRPTIIVAAGAGHGGGLEREFIGGTHAKLPLDRNIATAQATVTQPLYSGGRVNASIHKANNAVFAERANLIAEEESAFSDTVNAYVGVVQARDIAAIDRNNEKVLGQQLKATQDRFRVGEITQTDVAQAQAALASATATRLTAEGTVQTAEATYLRAVGSAPPADLVPPEPLKLPLHSEQQAAAMAGNNNPSVISALFGLAGARNAVDVAFGALLPQLSLQGQAIQSNNASQRSFVTNGYQVLANLSVPLYQGGAEYSAVRQARETVGQQDQLVADAKRTAVQNAVQAWETLQAALASAASSRAAVDANRVALEGTERQALVGTATTLDVLITQQTLLNSQTSLVQNLASIVTASYAVASAVGRLTARDLALPVNYYNDTAYYEAVKNKWFGLKGPDEQRLYGTSVGSRP
ncbi:MAG TPA: TolC family outer membrane protein [Acetobacteraceae bacterium]